MASGNGYNSETKGSVQPFTVVQRQRLEAVTFARALKSSGGTVNEWLSIADFIVTGATPWNPHDC